MTKTTSPKASKKPRWWLRILVALIMLLALAALLFVGYFLWNSTHSLPANIEQISALQTNPAVHVQTNGSYYVIEPAAVQASSGIIMYPGAFTEPTAYIPRYAQLAEQGIAVYIIRSPFNFALFDINRANRIIRENPSVEHWFVAGHSLGGVAACEYAKTHQAQLSGLILLASYCNGDATSLSIPVLSISGSQDGLATPQKIADSKQDLPASTQFVLINGGNHTLFGSFAKTQPGDGSATINEATAQQQILSAITNFVSQSVR